jgi:hypothetical protein
LTFGLFEDDKSCFADDGAVKICLKNCGIRRHHEESSRKGVSRLPGPKLGFETDRFQDHQDQSHRLDKEMLGNRLQLHGLCCYVVFSEI